MAKYIVEETKTSKYEKNFKFPLINLIPAIVWCIPVHQKLSPLAGTMGAFIAVAAFFILYVLLSYVPIAALAPGVASVIMMTAMLWAPADHIGNNVARAYFEKLTGQKLPIPKVNVRVDKLLRDFILEGGFEIEVFD